MGCELTGWGSTEEIENDCSAQEVGMRKLRCQNALLNTLMAVALSVLPAHAQDYGGTDSSSAIDWRSSYRRAADEASRDGKLLLVSVTANWCGPCRQMKQLTFTDSRVIELVRSDFVPLTIDADTNPELVTGFGVEAYPTTFIVAPDLTILKRMSGFQSASDLVGTMKSLVSSTPTSRLVRSEPPAVSALEPANAVKFEFDGYCLVSLLEESRILRGSSEFIAEHRGHTVCFQTEEHRNRFLQEPDKYWPMANGQCLVSSRESGSAGKGDPRMAVTWRGRIWLFSDRERQQRFIQTPHYYINEL
jgi:thiol-disulfide isomerase/thioredoxin